MHWILDNRIRSFTESIINLTVSWYKIWNSMLTFVQSAFSSNFCKTSLHNPLVKPKTNFLNPYPSSTHRHIKFNSKNIFTKFHIQFVFPWNRNIFSVWIEHNIALFSYFFASYLFFIYHCQFSILFGWHLYSPLCTFKLHMGWYFIILCSCWLDVNIFYFEHCIKTGMCV